LNEEGRRVVDGGKKNAGAAERMDRTRGSLEPVPPQGGARQEEEEDSMRLGKLALMVIVMAVVVASFGWATGGGENGGGAKILPTKAGTFPIATTKVEFNIVQVSRTPTDDINATKFMQWYEAKTNVHLNFQMVPFDGAAQKINLIIAGGELPDAFSNVGFSKSEMVLYGSSGVFVPLNDMIEKWSVNLKKLLADRPAVKQKITNPDQKIYDLITIDECYHCSMNQKLWIYMPWLTKLGLKMPETTDDMYNVLKAFKTRDPNGNGVADEIPFAACPQGWASNVDGFLMMPFVYHDYTNHMFVDKGKVQMAFTQAGWKEGLKYLHKLYAEGLISSESWTQTRDQFQNMGENPKYVILGTAADGFYGDFVLRGTSKEGDRFLDYKCVPPLKGPTGIQWTFYSNDFVTVPGQFSITKSCKNPEVLFRYMDGLLDEEMTLNKYYGPKGVGWDVPPKGSVSIIGGEATWMKLKTDKAEGIALYLPHFYTSKIYETEFITVSPTEKIMYEETKQKYEPYKPPASMILPDLYFNEAQSGELLALKTPIENYYKEMTARFITGDADIDKGWDAYLKEFERMNLKRYLELYQQAYSAQVK
jgi:putative aldouronate transport system substrate-binding protein